MSAYTREFDETKSSIKVKNNIKKGFDSEPVYNEKYLKVKIKPFYRKRNQHKFSQ